jgi:tetratricopeptide (TPR) repeat protein
MAGHALANVAGEVEEGEALLAQAINLDPNLVIARHWSGWGQLWLGDVDAAIEQFNIALRLNPLDPRSYNAQAGLAYAHFLAGRNEDASSWAAAAIRLLPSFLPAQFILAACHAMSDRVEEAREVCARATQRDPTRRITGITALYRRREDIEKLAQAFRIAGMPE